MDKLFEGYDEFGNPIGEEEESYSDADEEEELQLAEDEFLPMLPEDRKYFPDQSEVYPPQTVVRNEMEDTQSYNEPIIKEERKRRIALEVSQELESNFDEGFLISLLNTPQNTRNIAVVGNLASGKTELIDAMIKDAYPHILDTLVVKKNKTNKVLGEGRRLDRLGYMDWLYQEHRRKMTITAKPMTLVGTTYQGKSIALNIIDTPGHPDFFDQVKSALELVDGVLFCVDVVEGLTKHSKRLLEQVVRKRLRIVLVLTKIDRLIMEMKLPPGFARRKIERVVEEVNTFLQQEQYPFGRLSPELFNVVFSSAQFELILSLDLIGYLQMGDKGREFSRRLWGSHRMHITSQGSTIISSSSNSLPHPFELYVLEVIYKIFTNVPKLPTNQWKKELGIDKPGGNNLSLGPRYRCAFRQFFHGSSSLISAIYDNLPAPSVIGDQFLAYVALFVPNPNGESTSAVVRILNGRLEKGMELVASYVGEEPKCFVVGDINLSHCRFIQPIASAGPGMIVLIDGELLNGRCVVSTTSLPIPFDPLLQPYAKVAIEPIDPKAQNDLLQAMNIAKKVYLVFGFKSEASDEFTPYGYGEYVLFGTGELFFECVLLDLRQSFASLELRVSNPFVVFNETVNEKSVTICRTQLDEKTKIGIIAEPITRPVAFDLESGRFESEDPKECLEELGWDPLKVMGFLCFGPDKNRGPNALVNDTLDQVELDENFKRDFEQAFDWATLHGPLCDEMIRGVVFRLAIYEHGPNWISPAISMPLIRKAMFASILAARPRVMEPIYAIEIQSSYAGLPYVRDIIRKRRGKIIKEKSIDGTQLHTVSAKAPLIDIYGMETELRAKTSGQAFCLSWFDHWDFVPGDPLASATFRPLEPSEEKHLAREYVVKTRRRRGLGDDVDLSAYCDEKLLIEIAQLSGTGDLL